MRMGYHYGPCRKGGAGAGAVLMIFGVVVLWRFAHQIIEAITLAVIGMTLASLLVAIGIGVAITTRKAKLKQQYKYDGRSILLEDRRILLLMREWLALPIESRVAPEWDFFTGLNDGNRAKALESMKRAEMVERASRNPR